MSSRLEELRRRMAAAAEALDFEEASRLRDQISLLQGQPDGETPVVGEGSLLRRQEPGKMGLGTSDQRMAPPPGWTKPRKPDLMTNVKPRKR